MSTTTGKYSGRQPAMTELTASFSTVTTPFFGGMAPSSAPACKPEAATNSATRSGVGGTTGSPSLQPASTT